MTASQPPQIRRVLAPRTYRRLFGAWFCWRITHGGERWYTTSLADLPLIAGAA